MIGSNAAARSAPNGEAQKVHTRHLVTLIAAATVGLLAPRSSLATGVQPTWGVRLGNPQIVSASVGILVGEIDPKEPPATGTQLPTGLLVQIEPGLGGGKASIGYAKGLLPYAAAGVKVSLLRTWGHPLFAEPRRTYLGVEGEATFFIKLSVGVLRRVAGEGDSGRWMVTGGIGLGF
jgi:hypothetical protein